MIEVIVSVGAALALYLAVEAVLSGISWGFRKIKAKQHSQEMRRVFGHIASYGRRSTAGRVWQSTDG